MTWLNAQRHRIFFAMLVLLSLPTIARHARDTVSCFDEVRSASWSERALVAIGLRRCPLHRN